MQPDSDGFITRAAALKIGYTDKEFARLVANGDLRRIAKGTFYPGDEFDALHPAGKHRLKAIATVRGRKGHAVSHVSAAAMHGLSLWNTDLNTVHLSTDRPTGGRKSAGLHIHTGRLDQVMVGSTPVTSPARTIVDTARILDLNHSVVIGDSGLRKLDVTHDDLEAALEESARLHNIAAARRAVALMNGLSESPGESLSRLRMEEYGMPKPTLQHRIPHLGFRVDFFWEEFRIVGEFDGKVKYDNREANLAEKVREDALRDEGYAVFRWMWDDLWNFAEVRMRFERAKARATFAH
ncbi:hypothetical protein [Rhodococcoides kyotonense]|uniref:Transcriptional regulator, AbiEi antitoxin, Type IV TA system n=1 Tax=Rhodococcoides kyotonense TaxID=398843 RepID=A0A239NDD5_9NOCA|nr:hypothetical protein [Rhodococcus kyotonensis]SNT52434.1 Transcriptional regulator, AbiEi antitoxin, Type IV TA system [Rhodococcus kyotonensis]